MKRRVLVLDYRKYGDTYYIKVDKNEEIIKSIIAVCKTGTGFWNFK